MSQETVPSGVDAPRALSSKGYDFSSAIRITAKAVPVNNNKLIRHCFFTVEVYEE